MTWLTISILCTILLSHFVWQMITYCQEHDLEFDENTNFGFVDVKDVVDGILSMLVILIESAIPILHLIVVINLVTNYNLICNNAISMMESESRMYKMKRDAEKTCDENNKSSKNDKNE